MTEGVGFGREDLKNPGGKGEKLQEDEEEEKAKKNERDCKFQPSEVCSALHGPGIAPLLRSRNTGATEGRECGLEGPENEDQENAELHGRKSPEFH